MKNNKKINFDWNKTIIELSENNMKNKPKIRHEQVEEELPEDIDNDLSDDLNFFEVINKIPQQPQVQYNLNQQLQELIIVANKLGLYDAADFINNLNF
jgi:hypothetical protein